MSSDLFAKVNLKKLDKISQKRLEYLSCLYLKNGQDVVGSRSAFQNVLSSYDDKTSLLVQAEKQFLV
ncbi:hypothetical protein [Streptococcus equinus]|uniref:hypothetical protein n=1 Tax=Streptococcus equinus TaxID=1335 RepID=UPI000B11D083|nr:hypothetical protein [Streptococcus equinus]